MVNQEELTIGIVGLGYVGLPLAVEFGKNADLRAAQPIPWRRAVAAQTAATDSSQLD